MSRRSSIRKMFNADVARTGRSGARLSPGVARMYRTKLRSHVQKSLFSMLTSKSISRKAAKRILGAQRRDAKGRFA